MKENQALKATPKLKNLERPVYVQPRVQVMSERDVLNTFQVTQAMQTWWTTMC